MTKKQSLITAFLYAMLSIGGIPAGISFIKHPTETPFIIGFVGVIWGIASFILAFIGLCIACNAIVSKYVDAPANSQKKINIVVITTFSIAMIGVAVYTTLRYLI